MKKVNALVLGLAVLLAFGCGGDEKKDDPTPQNPVNSNRMCLPVNVNAEYGSPSNVNYFYNAQGQINRTTFGQANNPNGYELISYSSTGKITKIREYSYSAKTIQKQKIYQYNADSLVSKEIVFEPSVPGDSNSLSSTWVYDFEYDVSKRLVKISSFLMSQPSSPDTYINYTYNPDGSLREEVFAGNPARILWDRKYQFNANKAPGGNLAYFKLPSMYRQLSNGIMFGRLPVSLDETQFSPDGTGHQNILTYSYLYNAEGYPIEQIMIFPGQPDFSMFWTYNCQ